MTDYDVVVCGAGPAGLTLAAALGAHGRRVLVLEQQRTPTEQYKGEVLQPRSQQILDHLGLLTPLRQAGHVRMTDIEARDSTGRQLVSLDYSTLDTPHNNVSVHYYHEIQRALCAGLGPAVEVVRGARVAGLLRAASGRVVGVTAVRGGATETVTAAVVVGCEGQRSACRAHAGLSAGRVRRYAHDLFGFDIQNPPELPPRMTVHVTDAGLRIVYPMPHGRARLYVQIAPGGAREIRRRGLADWLRSLGHETPALADTTATLAAHPGKAQALPAKRWAAPRWSVPGLVLVGDAAHGVHPMAGQGMNAAIGDAWALADCLRPLEEHRRWGQPARIDAAVARYERRRKRQLTDVARISHHLALAFTTTSGPIRAVSRLMMASNTDNRRLQHILTYNLSGLGLRPFTPRDRLYQLGILRDPKAHQVGL
jgi:2-polyprenyl-6-methoxyphenol hydroxylase-like FAD-dependent oxidoreductase